MSMKFKKKKKTWHPFYFDLNLILERSRVSFTNQELKMAKITLTGMVIP